MKRRKQRNNQETLRATTTKLNVVVARAGGRRCRRQLGRKNSIEGQGKKPPCKGGAQVLGHLRPARKRGKVSMGRDG